MDAYEDRKRDWEELEVSRDELKTLTECMKQEEFRKLLMDYAAEVSDPENRKLYEAEITQLERERGVDVTFVNPEPGYVIKTSLDGRIKCFLNVGQSERVDKPTSRHGAEGGAAAGLSWSIPYILAPPRDDLDKRRSRCRVFDVVFHPDTLYLAGRNPRFRQIVNETAMDGVESSFKVKLDRKNIKFPKMSFKGVSQPTVIRKPCDKPAEKIDIEPEIYEKLMSSYDASRQRHSKVTPTRPPPPTVYHKSRDNETENVNSKYTTPKFIIKHQSCLEMDEFVNTKEAKMHAAIPKNLVIVINLPLLKSASDATLDVQERHLSLKSEKPAKYHLELPLSYRVDPDNGNAKFDSKLRHLTITLPVIRDTSLSVDGKEDSGVESDHGSPLPESGDSSNQSESLEANGSTNTPNNSLICVLSETEEQVQSDCIDTALRTNEDTESSAQFMNPHTKYSLPAYTCNIYDNVLAITIHAKNVDPESIQHIILKSDAGLHILLTSIGAGFFPVHYSLCLKLEKDSIISDSLTIEPWDNNVVISTKLRNPENLSSYSAGLNEECMEAKSFSIATSIKNKLQALEEDPELETEKNVEVIRSGSEVIVNVQTQNLDSDDEHENESHSQGAERKQKFIQTRSISESSGDELSSSIGSSNGSGRCKGILKSRRFSRSVSESTIEDSSTTLFSTTYNDSTNEFHSESEGCSLKKTVRFNDVVSRQVFRFNSSILGQRKKNQRKLKNKKRAHDRRLSESENSETDEREKYKVDVKKESEQDLPNPIRPILHQSNKYTEPQKTANIKIERSPRDCNKRKQKRNAKANIVVTEEEKAETENNSDVDDSWKSSELKNDLLFDLDI